MAVYEYLCPKCRNEFELMRPMSEAEKPASCPKCGSEAQKLISGFSSKTGDSMQPAGEPFSKSTVVGEVGLEDAHGERRDMAQESLLQQLEEVASKVRLLERERARSLPGWKRLNVRRRRPSPRHERLNARWANW